MEFNGIPSECFAFDKILQPSPQCQVCMRSQFLTKDYIVTCNLCRSSIHQTHYGYELPLGIPQKWKCQRCREMVQYGPQYQIECRFCPSKRGIMVRKTYLEEVMWVHPQCAAWWFPILTQKKEHLKLNSTINRNEQLFFWYRIPNQPNQSACTVCKATYGKPIKCMYYTCQKYFHVTCAKREGVVRDLESMRLTNDTEGVYTPVYCKQHLEKRVEDFKLKAKQSTSKNQHQRANHFNKLANLYSDQLRNLISSAEKYKFEENIRQQMNHPNNTAEQQYSEITFNDLPEINETLHQAQFINYLQMSMPFRNQATFNTDNHSPSQQITNNLQNQSYKPPTKEQASPIKPSQNVND